MDSQQGLLCLLPSEKGVVHLKGTQVQCPGVWHHAEENRAASYGSADELVCSDVPLGPTLVRRWFSLFTYNVVVCFNSV